MKGLPRDGKATDRAEAFSDSIFAVAITLLILDFKLPKLPDSAGNAELLSALSRMWPSWLALIMSFITILIMWINHHGFFELLDDVDHRLLFANGFLLLTITVVPFPTAVLAHYIDSDGANAAAALYCATFVVVNVSYNLLWFSSAWHRRLIKREIPDSVLSKIRNAYLFTFPVYVVAVALSFLSAYGGLAICMALWILWARLRYAPDRPAENG